MKIGIVGGTGDIGEGMAMRLSPLFDVIVGSREEDKAEATCTMGRELLNKRGTACSLTGVSNQDAIDAADIVILAIPFKHLAGTLGRPPRFRETRSWSARSTRWRNRIISSSCRPAEGSAALMIRRMLPKEARICSAFNTIAANKWKALDEELEYSVPVCSDDAEAKKEVMAIVNRVSRLKAFDAGPLSVSCMVESLTPLLLNIARYNKMKDVGIQFR